MKNILIGLVIAVLLIGGIAGASVLYSNLSEEYNNENNGGFEQMIPVGVGTQGTEKPTESTTEGKIENVSGDNPEATTEKAEIVTEETEEITEDIEITTEKSDVTGDKPEETTEKAEQTTAKLEETTEKVEETTEKLEETTEKLEETTEKIELVFNAPSFTVLDWDGNSVKLSDFAGKPIVLNFWATWCYYCKVEMPEFDEAAKNLTNVQFLMVNATDTETMSDVKKYIESQGFEFDVFFDTTGMAQYTYGVSAYPTTFFISADGSKIYYISGMIDYELLLEGISLITD